MLRKLGVAIALGWSVLTACPALAQEIGANGVDAPQAETESGADIAAQRETLKDQIAALRVALEALEEGDATAERLSADLRTLERIDGLYLRWQEQVDRSADLARQRNELDQRIASGFEAVVGEAPPYSLSRIDALEEAWKGASAHEADLEALARVAREGLEKSRRDLAEKEKQRRELLEANADAGADDPFENQRRMRDLARVQLEIRFAKAQHNLAKAELDNANAELELQRLQTSIGNETLAWARERLNFDSQDLERMLGVFDKRELDARESLDRARVALSNAERSLASAQSELDASDPGDAAKLEARRLARQTAQRRVAQIDAELARLPLLRALTEQRHRLLSDDVPRSELDAWEEETGTLIAENQRGVRLAEGRVAELRRRSDETLGRAEASSNVREARWLRRQHASLDELVNLYREELAVMERGGTLARRAAADLERQTDRFSLVDVFDAARDALGRSLDTELMVVDERSVTTGKVLSAVVLFVLGFIASRFASRLLRRLLARTFSMDSGAAVAFQGLSFYVLLTLFFLLSLRTVGIPLTAFTLLGGGIAIGVGFGSQNIVNNFISGLILMLERPIKVGDIVEVDKTFGHIEQIGARSTRVRTFDNIHIIVPNSSFLERNVVNWTHSDNLVRTFVDVGVAYGSPTRDVDRLIHRALADHGKVLGDPEPVVLFTDFGDNALVFRAYFWLRMRVMMDRRRIESDVRHRIDRLFRDAGITIAFPQRDVHLDTLRPLEVRLTSEGAGEPEST